jgi:AcrR family transcriptional regulator
MSTSTKKKRATFHHGDLDAALRKAALGLVKKRGLTGFSLREVARAVGVSATAAYRHFADRDALLAALAADGFGLMSMEMERVLGEVPPGSAAAGRKRLRALGAAYVRFAMEQAPYFRLMFGPYGLGGQAERVRAFLDPKRARPIDLVRRVVDEVVAAGAIPARDVEHAVGFLWSTAHGLAELQLDGALSQSVHAADVVDATLDRLVRSVTG